MTKYDSTRQTGHLRAFSRVIEDDAHRARHDIIQSKQNTWQHRGSNPNRLPSAKTDCKQIEQLAAADAPPMVHAFPSQASSAESVGRLWE